MDEGKVICCELIIARRDPPTLLDLVEEPLDQIAGAIKVAAKANWLRPVPPRRDVCRCAMLADASPAPLSGHRGHWPEPALNGSVAIDPTETLAALNSPIVIRTSGCMTSQRQPNISNLPLYGQGPKADRCVRRQNAGADCMSSGSLIAELEVAVKSGTPEKRVETLRRVTSLFLGESDQLNEQQIGVFDDVLVHLIQRIETKALAQLSTSLAPVDNAPIEVIRRLSGHDEITVAGPVLTQSNRLSEYDLIAIAKSKGQGHLLAISERSSLTESLTDVLVERGDRAVTHRLARNSGARFSESGFTALVRKSEMDEGLAEKLGLRLDIPLQLLRPLLSRATDLVRSQLLAGATPENRDQIQRTLASIANEVGREAIDPRDFKRADSLVSELNRHGKLTETVLDGFAREHRYEEMTATLALFCGAKSELIERLLRTVRPDGLIVACKAAKLNWSTVSTILKARFSRHSISDQELDEAKKAFIELSQGSAQRTMRFMQVQEATKKTG